MKNFSTIFLVILILACRQNGNKNNLEKFTKPYIKNSRVEDTMYNLSKNFINNINPKIAGKYKFLDTLELFTNGIMEYLSKDFISTNLIGETDSTLTDGFELVSDYSSNVCDRTYGSINYYPVYLINQTPNIKTVYGKDSYTFGIQEAIDSDGYWRPIEGRGYDFCSVGYFGLKVFPKEYLVLLFPKYKGSYRTKLRIRLKVRNSIYVSKPFDGIINYNQFYLEKDCGHYRSLIESEYSCVQNLFYGAIPYEIDEMNGGLKLVK